MGPPAGGLTGQQLGDGVRAWAADVHERRAWLVDLDRAVGDADHGTNLDRGLAKVVVALDEQAPATPAAVLKLTATTLISSVGGAAGPLYGTAFLRAAGAVGDDDVDAGGVVALLEAALGGVVARGKAEVGDCTMVDAWAPAVDAAREAEEGGGEPSAVLAAAARGAAQGASSTEPLVARKGRASYLGERSAGHLDPGAASTQMLLEALAGAAD